MLSTTGRIGEIIVSLGKISSEQLVEVLAQQHETGQRLGDILRERGLVTERDIAEAMAAQLGVPFCDVDALYIDPASVALLPASVAHTYAVLPVAHDSARVQVVMLNPHDTEALETVRRLTGREPQPRLAERAPLRQALEAHYGPLAGCFDMPVEDTAAAPSSSVLLEHLIDRAGTGEEEHLVGDITDRLIANSLEEGATALHLEPCSGMVLVRTRVDGTLHTRHRLARTLHAPLIDEIKRRAGLDTDIRRAPQNGHLTFCLHGQRTTLTVSTLPGLHGERATLKPLPVRRGTVGAMPDVEMSPENRERLTTLLARTSGLILLAAPDAEARSALFYAALEATGNDPGRNVLACEREALREVEGVTQVPVDAAAGLNALRQVQAALRQDPDVLAVSDLTDAPTIERVTRAATSGVLVIASLEASDTVDALLRLRALGLPNDLLSASLIGAVGERSLRRLCLACRTEATATEGDATLGLLPGEPVYTAGGCEDCQYTGYRGHLFLHEVLIADAEVARFLRTGADAEDLRAAVQASGTVPLRDTFLARIRAGLTSPAEVRASALW